MAIPDPTPDQVSAYLDEMWRRWNAVGPESGAVMLAGPVGASAMDVPVLLAAVEAALALADPADRDDRDLDGNPEGPVTRVIRADVLRETISAALLGEGESGA